MSLGPSDLDSLDTLLPSDDIFKQPETVSINQDVFSSLDLPDFSNFAVDDVDFGDLEFLDLASVPLDKNKKSTQSNAPYFNSIATPSGHCSTNYLTEESNRLTVLLSDTNTERDKNILDNLEEFFRDGQSESEKSFTPSVGAREPAVVFGGVPQDVLSLLEPPTPAAGPLTEESNKSSHQNTNNIQAEEEESFRQITIKSIISVQDSSPPPGAVAKIVIQTNRKNNFTKFIFASIDDRERHSFKVKTSNIVKAISALKPLKLDSIEVIRRLLRLGPKIEGKSAAVKTESSSPSTRVEVESPACQTVSERSVNLQTNVDEESALKESLLSYGINIPSLVRVQISSGQKFWCCPEPNCGKAYGKGHELKLHLFSHYNVKPFQCDIPGCSWAFVTRNKLNRHKLSHGSEKYFSCNIQGCNKNFTTVYNLNSHLKLHQRSFSFSCEKCEAKFQTEREREVHLSQRHKQEVEPHLKCSVPGCQAAYFTRTSLNNHVKTHSTVSQTTCEVCAKVFAKKSQLTTHMVFHTGERPYHCQYEGCKWSFPTKSKLARHRRTHTNERRFVCALCEKTFSRSEHLQQHSQTHAQRNSASQATAAQCPVLTCSRSFTTTAGLRSHMRSVHSKDTVVEGEDISAGQLDFVALLSCVQEYNIPTDLQLPVQVEEEVVTMDTDLLHPVLSIPEPGSDPAHPPNCSDILFTDDNTEPSTINLQDLE